MTAFTRDDWRNLIERRKSIMTKLATLPDCRATAPADPNTRGVRSGHAAQSAPPPEVDLNRINREGPPPKERSLYAHYEWRFDAADRAAKAATGADKLLALLRMDSLCSQALRDYLLYTGRIRRPSGDVAVLSAYADDRNVERLLSEYVGVAAAEVAIWEMCPVKWVRRERVKAGMDGETGEPRPRSERTERVLALHARGLPQRAIAAELGVSAMTVNRVLAAA